MYSLWMTGITNIACFHKVELDIHCTKLWSLISTIYLIYHINIAKKDSNIHPPFSRRKRRWLKLDLWCCYMFILLSWSFAHTFNSLFSYTNSLLFLLDQLFVQLFNFHHCCLRQLDRGIHSHNRNNWRRQCGDPGCHNRPCHCLFQRTCNQGASSLQVHWPSVRE